jgi:alpha-L-glutamate ligase-like protein
MISLTEAWHLFRHRANAADVVGINRRNVELVYAHNRRRDYPLVDDKILCKEQLVAHGVPVATTIATCEGLFEIDRVADALTSRGDFVVKPASGSGGNGILVIGERVEGGWKSAKGRDVSDAELRKHMADIVFGAFSKQMDDRVLVEERIVPHELFREFFAGGVSDLRLIFLRGECLMSMVRIPTIASGGRANLHQGGIGVAVDIETGQTTRAVSRGASIEVHPETGGLLVGRQIPDWPHVFDVGRRAALAVPLGYVGVDLVIDAQRGPLVLELNARPGLEIQNINGRGLGPAVARVLS